MSKLLAALLILVACGAMNGLVADGDIRISVCKESSALDRFTRKPALSRCKPPLSPKDGQEEAVTAGDSAPDERFTAAIFYEDKIGNLHICTGTLLDGRYVLTAGHCGCGQEGTYSVTFDQFAGRADRVMIGIEREPILFDPMTCVRGLAPGKDLALLRLRVNKLENAPRDFGYPVFALAADFRERMKIGEPVKVVGYGETETGSVATRMMAMVPVLTPDCFGLPYDSYCAPFQEMITADRTGSMVPHDTCGGDSGGPIYVRVHVRLPPCDGKFGEPKIQYENVLENDKIDVEQDVLVGVTSRTAPFTQPLAGGHCGGGAINTLIGRQSVYAWLEANHVRPQRCVHRPVPPK